MLSMISATAADSEEQPSSSKKAKFSRLNLMSDDEDSGDEHLALEQVTPPPRPANDEVHQYIDLVVDDNVDLVLWWRNIGSRLFPSLAKVARSVLGIPASSTSSERDFSSAGLIITPRRNSLDPEHVNELLVVRGFYKK